MALSKLIYNVNIIKSGKKGMRGMDDSTINCNKGCELISKSRKKGQKYKTWYFMFTVLKRDLKVIIMLSPLDGKWGDKTWFQLRNRTLKPYRMSLDIEVDGETLRGGI